MQFDKSVDGERNCVIGIINDIRSKPGRENVGIVAFPAIFDTLEEVRGEAVVGVGEEEDVGFGVFSTKIALGADVAARGGENGECRELRLE